MATRRSARLLSQTELKPLVPLAPPAANPRGRKRGTESRPSSTGPVTPPPKLSKAAGLLAADGIEKPKAAAVSRIADPRATNAPLVSPMTARVLSSRPLVDISPSKAASVTTTTDNILEQACQHLIQADERMQPLVDKFQCKMFSPEGLAEKIDPFQCLASGIIGQQVSGAAAASIEKKFVALFEDEGASGFPQPSLVSACSLERLRSAGLSQRKAEYIQGLAEKFCSGELSAQMLVDAPYDELLEKLIAVRGLGRWSVEMFAMFGLKRMDVFATGDLGIQRGMAAFVGRDIAKLKAKGGKWKYMSEADMIEISNKFAPYRSLFMWYMWRAENVDTSVLEDQVSPETRPPLPKVVEKWA
ncbi:unnamed protein product [Parascedosporium putredinis]|uniref:HhH-GPD domain-containing protein n=1 Tax=Parascedosporium putredinis TaxID=1442378 RepID=A0A9P1MA25_9PEZI|nr:unnamed protein product [Parascedosporium putredinis]CAI7995863.1 unnamed protein product [Parascedosporium putredinis]